MRRFSVLTHRRPAETREALDLLIHRAAQEGVTLVVDPEETSKHGLRDVPGMSCGSELARDVELCVVLGGDGTILRALQCYAGTGVPVFAINFGQIGFLAAVEHDDIEAAIGRAFDDEFELLHLPGIEVAVDGTPQLALNDVAIHRKVGERVAELAYALDGEVAGSVRCDGLVVSTPAGSTGYNLANGGPVMAWGVEGFVVSFIAPHSIAARALVVAPSDELKIFNLSREPLDVALDGRPAGEIPAEGSISVSFRSDVGTLAQLPGTSFYRRLRDKFGRLAS